MQKLKDEIREKKFQMRILEQRMTGSVEVNPHTSSSIEMSQVTMSRLYIHAWISLEHCNFFQYF